MASQPSVTMETENPHVHAARPESPPARRHAASPGYISRCSSGGGHGFASVVSDEMKSRNKRSGTDNLILIAFIRSRRLPISEPLRTLLLRVCPR